MSRRRRPHLPNSAFHLATRLHRSEALFEPELRTAAVTVIRQELAFTDLELLAYAIMPNHLHLVVRQGEHRLAAFMQPVLRRIALLVQRRHERLGHVFERRFRDTACADPEHLRNAIVYTHLNAVRAALSATVNDWAWTSHGAWSGRGTACDGLPDPVTVDRGLPLFASAADRSTEQLSADYLAFVAWRIEADRCVAASGRPGHELVVEPARPALEHGDLNWLHVMTPRPLKPERRVEDLAPRLGGATGRIDLADIARTAVAAGGMALDMAVVRSRWGGPPYQRARAAIILRAAAAGYSGVQLAAYLHISPSAVSRSLSRDRRSRVARAR
jgi:REP element-mobilizing transposase RayT